ncbi:MAG: Ig-like domain-containing protein [Candidatus Nomurabacteria bacterium]|nr:MAG: Ig-like domain-containing protein [Candidatus Nomurabacteria bacterium]
MLVKRLLLGIITGVIFTGGILLALSVAFHPAPAAAQSTAFTIENIGSSIGLGTADLKDVIINIIRWALGIMALVAVVFVIYGGYIWMTAGGNADKVDKAKQIIISAAVGLVIILISWAIVTFVINTVSNVTNGDTYSCDPGLPCGVCLLCDASGTQCNVPDPSPLCMLPSSQFTVNEILTAHDGPDNSQNVNRCSRVMPRFNLNVDSATVEAAVNDATNPLKLEHAGGGAEVSGIFTSSDKSLTFKHPDELFDSFADYTLFIPKTLESTGGLSLTNCTADGGCVDAGDHYRWNFTTNDVVDETVPSVSSAYPVISAEPGYPDRNVPRDPLLSIWFSEAIDISSLADVDSHPIPGIFDLQQLDGEGGAVIGTVSSDSLVVSSGGDNRVDIRFTDGAMLESFTWYRITVQNVEDLCGNGLQPPEVWEFQTNDLTAGIAAYDPQGGNVCPSTNITTVFTLSMWDYSVTIEIDNPATPGVDMSATMPAPSSMPGPDYEVAGLGGVFRIIDPNPGSPNAGFKVYQFDPNNDLSQNSDFNVRITTDREIDGDGNTLAGNWNFSVTDAENCTCVPFVAAINPNNGPPGQCVTIYGSCFTGTDTHSAQPRDPDFDTDPAFPPPTNTSPRLNDPAAPNYIVTTIPEDYSNGNSVYTQVTIDYDDGAYGTQESNTNIAFSVNSDTAAQGPCLASMSPSSGYRGQTVEARGVRFGSATGGVTYYNGQPATISSWSDTSAMSQVPSGAASNTHPVYVTDASDNDSNPVPFTVQDYPPNQIFVTDPWPTCQAVCPNVVLHNTFGPSSIDINASTLTTSTILLRKCSDASCTSFTGNVGVEGITYDAATDRLEFDPVGSLQISQWYAALLIGGPGGVLGSSGEEIGNTNTTYLGSPAYQWTFRTKDDPSSCAVDHVTVTPPSQLITVEDGERNFYGKAYASPDQCDAGGQQIDTDGTPWTWTVSPSGDADFATDSDTSDDVATVHAVQETTLPPAPDYATVRGSWSGKYDTSDLTIDFLWCDETTDCTQGGLCGGSTCNNAEHRCTPVITGYSPNGGDIGTWLTINGCYFGSYVAGTCSGGDNDGASCTTTYNDCPGGTCVGNSQVRYSSDKEGLWANSDICPNPPALWRNNVIVASEVPNRNTPAGDDAVDGPITVVRGLDGVSDSTNDAATGEPILPDFDVNSNILPGICALQPNSGQEAQPVKIIGQNFGTQEASDAVRFSGIDVSVFNGWVDALIDVLVPLGLPTGTVNTVVHKAAGDSNAFPFTITAPSCQVCVADSDCSVGNGCANSGCCAPQPSVSSTRPNPGDTDVCRNTSIEANFAQAMDVSTMTTDTVIVTVDGGLSEGEACSEGTECASGVCTTGGCVGNSVPITFTAKSATQLRVNPGLLLKNTAYRTELNGLRGADGVLMPNYSWVFTSVDSDSVCALTGVDITPALWNADTEGQEQLFTATPRSDSGPINEIPGVYEWDWSWDIDTTTVATLTDPQELPDGSATNVAKTGAENGQAVISATASVSTDGTEKRGSALVDYFRCADAWNFDDSAGNCSLGGGCEDYHFHLGYCRDNDSTLPNFDLQVIKGQTGDVQKQYLFKEADSNAIDAIGVRVYQNSEGLSPLEWYRRQFPFATSTPSSTTIDGYQALRDGRTVYLAGTNLFDAIPSLVPHIFVLSYNDGANDATRNIFQQMLNRIKMNTNGSIGPENKAKIIRDTKRLADLQDTSIGLEKYFTSNGHYPSLEAGSFLLGMSTSKWPSWQSTLGNALGRSMSVDPLNQFGSCPAGYEQTTCWNEPTKTFYCDPNGSNIYAYISSRVCEGSGVACRSNADCGGSGVCKEANNYSLYAEMEYDGPGKWTGAPLGDPCSFDTLGNSSCSCFNYQRP